MKYLNILLAVMLIVGLSGCVKDKEFIHSRIDYPSLDVPSFIDLLKAGRYKTFLLPVFTPSDIPELLKYRNETVLIRNFPFNPLSSFSMEECRLGVFVLWTIEGMRSAAASGSEKIYDILQFQSLNPLLVVESTKQLVDINNEIAHEIVSLKYYEWWTLNEGLDWAELCKINPLEGTGYIWFFPALLF